MSSLFAGSNKHFLVLTTSRSTFRTLSFVPIWKPKTTAVSSSFLLILPVRGLSMRNPRFSKSPCIILEDSIHPFKIFSEYFSIGWVETRRQLLCWVALSWEHSGILLNHTVITQGHNLLFMNVYEMLLRFTRKMLSFALTSLKCQGNILCATLLQCSVTNLKFIVI